MARVRDHSSRATPRLAARAAPPRTCRAATLEPVSTPVPEGSGESSESLRSREYSCCRVVEDGAGRTALDDLALPHDDDPVADVVGGREVVGDVDDRDAEVVAQRPEQVDDRHAQRGVDHRHRLVGDDERGLRYQRAGDRDPLQLAARELVREAAADLRERQADLLQRRVGCPLAFRTRPGAGEVARPK